MFSRIGPFLILLTFALAGADMYLYRLNSELKTELLLLRGQRTTLESNVAYLKSLPDQGGLPDLEGSFVSLAGEIAALREVEGTVAQLSAEPPEAQNAVAEAAKRVEGTDVFYVPVRLDVREYKFIEALMEAVHSLVKRKALVESATFDGGFSFKAELFGRIDNGQR